MYVYIESERFRDDGGYVRVLYTVGFYDPSGKWVAESDHDAAEKAAARVHYLNGRGDGSPTEAEIQDALRFGKTFG